MASPSTFHHRAWAALRAPTAKTTRGAPPLPQIPEGRDTVSGIPEGGLAPPGFRWSLTMRTLAFHALYRGLRRWR